MPLQQMQYPALGLSVGPRVELNSRQKLLSVMQALMADLQIKFHGIAVTVSPLPPASVFARQLRVEADVPKTEAIVFCYTQSGLQERVRKLSPMSVTPRSLFHSDLELYATYCITTVPLAGLLRP